MMYSDYPEGIENPAYARRKQKVTQSGFERIVVRSNLAPKIGRGKYVLAEYEKVKRITTPLGKNHLLYYTTELEADHSEDN